LWGGWGGKGKGKGKGWDRWDRQDQSYGAAPVDLEDRFPKVAKQLSTLREKLPHDALKAYHALQLALQRHSTPHGSRPNFEKDFHESLSALFPDAWDIMARQIGSWNQWEVRIDDGPAIYCSVRLEVLSEDTEFIHDVKSKAKIVKDTLLEDNQRWKKTLQPHGSFSFESLTQFRQECAVRVDEYNRGNGPQNTYGRRNLWVEQRSGGHGGSGEDELSNVFGQRLVATFQCANRSCGNTWTSHHARLRPDQQTVMGQDCSKCGQAGIVKEWRPHEKEQYDQGGWKRQQGQGMHLSRLCDACREFGNCMGVFYDPFVLTTALSLVSGQPVQWKSFSAEMPELLIADLGAQYRDLQVCLQPHVYVAQDDRVKGPGAFESAQHGYPRPEMRDARPVARGPAPGRSPLPGRDRDTQVPAAPHRREAGGVKDSSLYEGFLSRVDGSHSQGGAAPDYTVSTSPAQRWHENLGPAGSSGGQELTPRGFLERPTGPPERGLPQESKNVLAGDEAGGLPGALGAQMLQADAIPPPPPSEEKVPKAKKFNKIGTIFQASAKPSVGQPSTPQLDALPPLRRAQFLQVVLRHVKASGGMESDKFNLAEDYLSKCGGDYHRAYQHVKALSEGQ